jgi:hypothetical protein
VIFHSIDCSHSRPIDNLNKDPLFEWARQTTNHHKRLGYFISSVHSVYCSILIDGFGGFKITLFGRKLRHHSQINQGIVETVAAPRLIKTVWDMENQSKPNLNFKKSKVRFENNL